MKWWFSDYDGTINLQHDDSIDPRDLDFINRWIKNNNAFAIATGRMVSEVQEVLAKNNVPYNYIICNNGAMVYEKDKGVIVETPIPLEYRKDIIEVLDKLRDKYILGYCLLDQRKDYAKPYLEEIDSNPFLSKYAPKKNNYEIGKKDILENKDVNLIYVYVNKDEAIEMRTFLEKQLPFLKVVRTHINVIEIMQKDVSKAHGILEIQKLKGFKMEDVITSGDGENDIEMLALTKNSFTMKHHQPGVREHAEYEINNVFEIEDILNFDLT
ncbi:Cof-type HAD-IIB family hydrolase [Spiroplasma tabanidicola]|uniref:HAD superfamily hydrolase n=1 Tax=Spiroplasma tabanidicola TaxID=324079 RepID=A0A6I6C7Q9_9MOLU|nr:Cof-type HAD-IIB family hydrolase [Spiroplasma tabanidicola]QGS51469.1 HAD superfamily hydrolase [Spiroplasma tabanidicola]